MRIDEDMIVYPGNPEPEIDQYRKVPENSTTESKICIGSHTGTHVDAPMHVFEGGESVDEMNLETFYGPCQVLDVTECGKEITEANLEKHDIQAEIILLKTENSLKDYEEFREDFAHISVSGVEYLLGNDVKTLGMDYLSIADFDGGEKAHKKAIRNMTVFEGLYLKEVETGKYTFSGFPLKLGVDGGPARAVLIDY